MSLHEKLQTTPAKTAAAVGLVMAVAVVLFAYQIAGGDTVHTGLTEAFYSVDDGQTWFAEDASHVSGFDHDGQTAYLVHVYRAGDDPPFVGYLERFTPEARKLVVAAKESDERPGDAMQMRELYMKGQEIKKPGEVMWHRRGTPEASRVLQITPPAGSSGPLEPVLP